MVLPQHIFFSFLFLYLVKKCAAAIPGALCVTHGNPALLIIYISIVKYYFNEFMYNEIIFGDFVISVL